MYLDRRHAQEHREVVVNIGWIGGREKNETALERIATEAGHTLEFHSGHVQGRGADTLRALVERSEYLVIITEVNSHGAVLLAKKTAALLGRSYLMVRRCGSARFQALLSELRTPAGD